MSEDARISPRSTVEIGLSIGAAKLSSLRGSSLARQRLGGRVWGGNWGRGTGDVCGDEEDGRGVEDWSIGAGEIHSSAVIVCLTLPWVSRTDKDG